MTLLGGLILWGMGSLILFVVLGYVDRIEAWVAPRCQRCDGAREWGHRCPDAEVDSSQAMS